MCHDVSLAHGHLVVVVFISGFAFRVHVCVYGLHLQFAICDTIGCGVTCGDITMNSFTFSRESHWHMTKSVMLLKLL